MVVVEGEGKRKKRTVEGRKGMNLVFRSNLLNDRGMYKVDNVFVLKEHESGSDVGLPAMLPWLTTGLMSSVRWSSSSGCKCKRPNINTYITRNYISRVKNTKYQCANRTLTVSKSARHRGACLQSQ